ncbi:unnamed protein product [Caenorhabditis auriculariae]|uniref:Dendritic cell-specific transmembrane protein-like domain-containing protein n=1 Tax=Caenorhabditis auriculariae TaxID=2777116 RepID=A0A8S1HLY2_9PELO|nr:unnamed protein product [Caenorhabditis auriculariae]
MGVFDDPKRNAIREKTKSGFFTDFFFRSEVTDYRNLRIVINTIFGIFFCTSLYYFCWKKLNFGDFDAAYGILLKWFMIFLTLYAFATNSLFRCAFFCVLIGAFGKQGQYPFTMLIVGNLQEGPISNVVHNYELTSELVVCHLELQSKIISNRVALLTGPMEELVERMITKGTRTMRKIVKEVRELLSPFLSDLTMENTKEDKKAVEEAIQVQNIEKRKEKILKLWQKALDRPLTADDEVVKELTYLNDSSLANVSLEQPPPWKTFKTQFAQKFAARMTSRCDDIFNKGIDKCRDLATQLVNACKEAIFWPLEMFICPQLNIESICNNLQRRVQAQELCRTQLEKAKMDPSMEGDLLDVMNMTEELEENSKINLHTALVESPRLEVEYQLSDLKVKVKTASNYVKGLISITRQAIQAFFVYFVYCIFRDAVGMIRRYNEDVDFNNCFVNSDFWKIDQYRSQKGQAHLTHFSKSEVREWHVLNFFSFPTKTERRAALRPFIRWFVLMFTVVMLVLVDFYFYSFLFSVVDGAKQSVNQTGQSSANIEITGNGTVADFLKTMVNSNQSVELDKTISNEHCLIYPRPPNRDILIWWLFVPLILSFLFQVLFSFAMRRIVINYFMPFMYPRRSRVRLIYLFNKLLVNREKHRSQARARIRFIVERWNVQTEEAAGADWLAPDSFLKFYIIDKLFRTSKCLLCNERMRPHRLLYCSQDKCQASFCQTCVDDNHGMCYACLVTAKEVNSQRSQLLPIGRPSNPENKHKFLTHAENIRKKVMTAPKVEKNTAPGLPKQE